MFLAPGHPQDGQIVFYKISVDRGLKWEEAYTRSLELTGPHDGFYLSYKVRGNQPSCLLAEQNRTKFFTVYKPNIGRQSQQETFDSLCRKFHRVGAGQGRRRAGRPRDAHARDPWALFLELPLPQALPGGASAASKPALRAQPRRLPGWGCQGRAELA